MCTNVSLHSGWTPGLFPQIVAEKRDLFRSVRSSIFTEKLGNKMVSEQHFSEATAPLLRVKRTNKQRLWDKAEIVHILTGALRVASIFDFEAVMVSTLWTWTHPFVPNSLFSAEARLDANTWQLRLGEWIDVSQRFKGTELTFRSCRTTASVEET